MIKNKKNIKIQIAGRTYFCPVEVTMSIMGGKWTAPILWYLKGRTLRYNELKKLLVTISEKVLIKELKSLQQVGLIARKSYAEVPPKVEYTLSEYGKTIVPIIDLISKWGEVHSKKFGKTSRVNAAGHCLSSICRHYHLMPDRNVYSVTSICCRC